ncbi:hypothetical protein [Mucilaginibacter flavus]|uniref:hypothetical protein n=1 Tax=Mucilaginibacter flavus TaxID=931504 RepID=UPI0025B5350E|nr:hypothetical protein [Mucilaginibacter flavus]MDN3585016.1 hypothetical protein [Mucilaginibacter flavus]
MKSHHYTDQLKDFQRATVDYVFERFIDEFSPCNRFLVADEVGLGKTLVARGIIQRFYDHWKARGKQHLNVIYICSNQSIASQNLDRLNIEKSNQEDYGRFNRINDLAVFDPGKHRNTFLQLTALSPNTSFKVSTGGGIVKERAILYEILRKHPVFKRRYQKLSAILQLDVNDDTWASWVSGANYLGNQVRKEILEHFNAALTDENSLYGDLERILSLPAKKADTKQLRSLIGRLRRHLAAICVGYLRPDLIIMDEFQRFKTLISLDENSEVRIITDPLFNDPRINILLLSATPYKMYTLQSEEENNEDHFEEFKFVVNFLLNDTEKAQAFDSAWTRYSKALLKIGDRDWKLLRQEKSAVEALLRKVIARTERVTVSDDHNTLLKAIVPNTLAVSTADITNFIALDSLAKTLKNVNSPVEYCKSCPFPLSFMEGYQLQKLTRREIDNGNIGISQVLAHHETCFLPAERLDQFEPIGSPNAKLAYLCRETLYNGGADLLWIPPSLPYYSFGAPFARQSTYSKLLVFSSWLMVPKMIAALTSYECERLNEENESKEKRSYFGQAERARSRLRVVNDNKGFRTLPAYAIMYPCMTLSHCWQPSADLRDQQQLLQEIAAEIAEQISAVDIAPYISGEGRKNDERWPLIYMLLLDRKDHKRQLKRIESQHSHYEWASFRHDKDDSSAATEYYKKVFEDILFSDNPAEVLVELKLGAPSFDVHIQLAKLALGSPAICSFRLINAYCGPDESLSYLPFYGGYQIADAFRKFYNSPEHTAVVDQQGFDGAYWQNLVQYNIAGNFQAMLDEYTDALKDHFGLWDYSMAEKVGKLITLISENLGLRTVNVTGHTYESFMTNESPKHFRCHFAVALNQSFDREQEVMRADAVRNAFNSPFRPFVLATTSVGQEGLDFHLYCRKIMHWNLPANPVDFEQREGRINRFKNLAIRQNIAVKYRNALNTTSIADFWPQLFELAAACEKGKKSDLVPFWHVEPEGIYIERHAPVIPYSKEVAKLRNLLKTISLYRLSLGQPRQEELIEFLLNEFNDEEINKIQTELLINLSPYDFA